MNIRKLNSEFWVFLLAFLYRLPNLAAFVNDDDSLWKMRGYVFADAMSHFRFNDTAITYHPGVPLMWSQMFAIKIYGLIDDLFIHGTYSGRKLYEANHIIQNGLLIFFTAILITLVFYFVKKLLGEFIAIIFFLLLITEPFYTALARSIHNDLLLGTFMFLSFVSFYFVLTKIDKNLKSIYKNWMVYLPGIFGGLAILTKSTALFLFPMIILTLFYFLFIQKQKWKSYSFVTLIYLLSLIATFFIVWPAMWMNAGYTLWLYFYKGIFHTAIEDGHLHYWFGKDTMDPGYLFYPIILYGRISETLFLGFISGTVLLFTKIFKDKKNFKKLNINHFYVLNVIFFLSYILMLSITSKKLDRYILPVIYPMGIMTVYFIHEMFIKFGKKILYVFLVIFSFRVIVMTLFHPNYLAYYSPLIGGPAIGKEIIEPKWLVGFDKVSKYLNEINNKSDHQLIVVVPDGDLLGYFADFRTIYPIDSRTSIADYFVVYEFAQRKADEMRMTFGLKEENMVKKIDIVGVTYYKIYKR